MSVPRVLHQLWKTHETPARYTPLRETWLRHNPGWTLRLWTDADLAALVDERYPQLSALFHGYRYAIARADLGRYLVLETFGGVYADLDCECLQPLEALLEGSSLLIGLEPDDHLNQPFVRARGLKQILCPSFIASVPGHPFWAEIRAAVVASAGEADILDLTGPFLLTRTYEASAVADQITIAPAAQIYPVDKTVCWSGKVFDLETWEQQTRGAFVTHFWDGSWFRRQSPLSGLPWMVSVDYSGWRSPPPPLPSEPSATRISCVTVAPGAAPIDLALESYRRQTHANKEMLVVCDPEGPAARAARACRRDDVRLVAADGGDASVLLAQGAAAAEGAVLCRWDADSLHDPRRLQVQFEILRRSLAHVCALDRRVTWRPADRRLAISARWPQARSAMWIKDSVCPGQLGDDDALAALAGEARVSTFDMPRLLLTASVGDAGFETDWAEASARFEADRCDALVQELGKRLGVGMALPRSACASPRAASPPGEVLILTPVKDARRHLPRYFELVGRLDTKGAPLSIGILEGDSRDGTFEALEAQLSAARGRFARTVLLQQHEGLEIRGKRQAPELQLRRRGAIARARNRLLGAALDQAEWVLWLDVDVTDYPADLLSRLKAAGRDIVAAHCVRPDGSTFDENTWVHAPGRTAGDRSHLIDGLFQPPRGEGRLYLEAFAEHDLVRVDSVGGTALLVRGQLHRDGLIFPEHSYGGYIETEGLAMMARDMGQECWGLPGLRIAHATELDADDQDGR